MKYTFKQFQAEFPNDRACLEKIMQIQFGGTEFVCPGCNIRSKFHQLTKRRAYSCDRCAHHIYPCVGTIFEKSRTKLTHWFFALYLMTTTRHGVAAKELERQIGCTYKTAWRMAHELRKLMAQADNHQSLSGHVEIDETIIGGYQTRQESREKGSNKSIVLGMKERNGNLLAGPIKDVKTKTLEPLVFRNVDIGSTISTDEWDGYNVLDLAYEHGRVNHSEKKYVNGIHHVNTLEGHWSLLKRSIRGTHVHVSSQHLWKYVSEFSYRHNMRKSQAAMFYRLVSSFSLPRLRES
jgi:transposase-like protein